MHAGIGAASTDDFDLVICNGFERFFDTGLDTVAGFLALPAVVRRAVVLQTDCNAHLGADQLLAGQ